MKSSGLEIDYAKKFRLTGCMDGHLQMVNTNKLQNNDASFGIPDSVLLSTNIVTLTHLTF